MMFKRLASAPFLVSYCLFPLVIQLGELSSSSIERTNSPIDRNWVDLIWVALALLAMFVMVAKFAMKKKFGANWLAYRIFLILLLAYTLRFTIPLLYSHNIEWLPLAMEAKPMFYFFVAMFITSALNEIDDSLFINFASVLASLLMAEMLIKSILEGTVVRPFGSGEVNYDAALLVIALVVAYTSKQKIRTFQIGLIWLGLLFTFSRTSVVTAAIIHLWVRRSHYTSWILMLLVSFSFVSSFLLRDLSVTDLESLDRYWMWVTAIDFVDSDYLYSAFGVFPGNGLMNIDIPPGLQYLWDRQGQTLGVAGVYAFYFHSALLRLTLTWGWVIVLTALILGLYTILFRRISIRLKLLILITGLLGLTMGVFYLSNVGVIWWLAVLSVPELCIRKEGNNLSADQPAVAII